MKNVVYVLGCESQYKRYVHNKAFLTTILNPTILQKIWTCIFNSPE